MLYNAALEHDFTFLNWEEAGTNAANIVNNKA